VLRLQHALLQKRGQPHPTAATCRAQTAAEAASKPFGHSTVPVYTCQLTIFGVTARYDVQVLRSGCYVAERHRPGRAVYGCGAGRT
jgi:hypothetical protein